MRRITSDIQKLLNAPGIQEQWIEAARRLRDALGARGLAHLICDAWRSRFFSALQSDVPDWAGLAAFRCITDFNLPPERLPKLIPRPGNIPDNAPDCEKKVDSVEKVWLAYHQYFEEGRNIHSGKLNLAGEAEKAFLRHLPGLSKVIGGQAGNILWLWHTVGASSHTHVPYFAADLAHLSGMGDLKVLRWSPGWQFQPLNMLRNRSGVAQTRGSCRAPAGGSIVIAKDGRRLILQFLGLRDLYMKPDEAMPWDRAQVLLGGTPLSDGVLKRQQDGDRTWPGINLVCHCSIDERTRTLLIRLATEEELVNALRGRVDFAVLGGINTLFRDEWVKSDPLLQARLVEVADMQLRAMATQCRIRIGMELSGVPESEYARLLQRWCRDGIVAALGINGEDELPEAVGRQCLDGRLFEFWLDPRTLEHDLQSEANDPKNRGDHFEYLTYLRARRLAQATGVRTLYVHTNTLDFILRKDADPGALLRAQLADMMGKGLVIVALLKRAYGDAWARQLKGIPPVVKPEAMASLARFARDFEVYGKASGAETRLLHSGYWLAPSSREYSVAVVPVMWPPVPESGAARARTGLPAKLNATGAGDMTFGEFFYLGGV